MNGMGQMALGALVAGSIVLGGCSYSADSEVTMGGYQRILISSMEMELGISKQESLEMYKNAHQIDMGATLVDGTPIQEYKIEAFFDDYYNGSREIFVEYLYFADNTLVEMSPKRVEFQDQPVLVNQWMASVDMDD